ncbi:HlyD family efflux transporter periplasmic adaptor subunit [Mycoplasmatota bacterium zrk1]
MKIKTIIKITIFIVSILLLGSVYVRYGDRLDFGSEEVIEETSRAINTAEVSLGTIEKNIDGEGVIWPSTTEEIKSTLTYKVKDIFVQKGQLINTGDLLYTIDTEDLLVQLIAKNDELLAAIDVLEDAVDHVEYQFITIRALRNGTILESNVIEEEYIDIIKENNGSLLVFDTVYGELDIGDYLPNGKITDAEDYLVEGHFLEQGDSLFTVRITSSDFIKARDNVTKLNEEIDHLEWLINNYEVRAKKDCLVGDFHVSTGVLLNENTTVLTLNPIDEYRIDISVDEEDVANVFIGQSGNVTLSSGATYEAKVTMIDYIPYNETFTVTMTLASSENLLPGLSGESIIILERHENILRVPLSAIKTDSEGEYVMVFTGTEGLSNYEIENLPTEKRYIERGLVNSLYAEIISGVELGEEVIIIHTITTYNESGGKSGLGLKGKF